MEQRNTEHRQNSGIPRNSDKTTELLRTPVEHLEIPTEHERNTSEPPRNNGTIQNEEQL